MASLATVRLDKGEAQSWGFRLQGGTDFGTPLVIQKVNVGSPAERAGLIAGDSVIKVNHTDVFNLRHKDAQDVILRAGHAFELTIQRGGSTWKPNVIPLGTYATHSPTINNVSPVTKTSLAAHHTENIGAIGTGHNVSAKPFNQQNGSTVNGAPKVVNNQYNSPLKLYSDESIAETLSAQTEVLSTGALGVNFKKNEKNYDATNSAVFRMLKEAESDTRSPEPVERSDFYATHSHAIGGQKSISRSNTPLNCQNRSSSRQGESLKTNYISENLNQDGATICTDCERVIVGVFVRIKDKNLHVECFKCSTCGSSLKNVGYYNINNKLYCDIHAKLAAINNPPAPNLVPVTVSPGGKIPTHAISSAISAHSYSSPAPLSPYQQSSNSLGGPKPFASVSAPLSPQNYNSVNKPTAPLSPISAPSYSPISSTGRFSTKPYIRSPSNLFKGAGTGRQTGAVGVAPRRGRGVLNTAALVGNRIALCGLCHKHIRGPFITALGKIWCPDHFICSTQTCRRPLQDLGFVEERGELYCEYCFEQYLAPPCSKCSNKIKGDCLKAIGKNFHPECFNCVHCGKHFGNSPFFLEDGNPYCDADWNEFFTTKCFACGFPVEAGDRWVEALNNNYHNQCFNCTMCKKNLEGQSFFAKGGRPYCRTHAR